jgi:hypothetical protein
MYYGGKLGQQLFVSYLPTFLPFVSDTYRTDGDTAFSLKTVAVAKCLIILLSGIVRE